MTLTELKKTCDQYLWDQHYSGVQEFDKKERMANWRHFPIIMGNRRVSKKRSNCFYLETIKDDKKTDSRIDWPNSSALETYTDNDGFLTVKFYTNIEHSDDTSSVYIKVYKLTKI